jgi:RHS repeat-associated protein
VRTNDIDAASLPIATEIWGGSGSEEAAVLMTATTSDLPGQWKTFGDIGSTVQEWVANSGLNEGVLLKASNENMIDNLKQICSSEYSDINLRPRLVVSYYGFDSKYFLKDHLGSIRVTIDENANVLGYDDFYPYGLQMPGRSSNTSNPNDAYKFAGNELDRENGVNLTHIGVRSYDMFTGQWTTMDPMEEFHTPYSYVGGNPVNLVDFFGLLSGDPDYITNPEGQKIPIVGEYTIYADKYEPGAFQSFMGNFLFNEPNLWRMVIGTGDRATNNLMMSAALASAMTFAIPGGIGSKGSGLLKTGGKVSTQKFIEKHWAKGTLGRAEKSAAFHLSKHGNGRNIQQYTKDAMEFFRQNRGNAIIRPDKTGNPAYHIPGYPGGWWTLDGKIITFWD